MKQPLIIAAPLAGYTNLGYRTLLKSFGVDLVVSEMISDYALIYHNQETLKMIKTSSEERPVALQLFGGNKKSLIEGLKILEDVADYDYLDINLGCPVPKVFKNNAGSSWLLPSRQYELYDTFTEIVKTSHKPVSAKIRLGVNNNCINCVEVAQILEAAGVKLITVHGRTREQYYEGNANYDYIKKVKENVKIKVIANGDIFTLDKAIEVLDYTKCDGVALGRGLLGNPFLATQIKHYYQTNEKLPSPSIHDQMDFLKRHFYLLLSTKDEHRALLEIRGIASHYLKGFTNVKEYKVRFSQIKSVEEFEKNIKAILLNNTIERVN